MHETGLLLVNLGTPDAPEVPEVRRYLREFLSDPRVIDLPAPVRWLLLHLVILPRRPRQSAHAYASIWSERGSPLLMHGRDLATALRAKLAPDGIAVALGMRYGNPSIPAAVERLRADGARRLLGLPRFPQYSEAATGSALARVREVAGAYASPLPLLEIGSFYDHPAFARAWRSVARKRIAVFAPDHVLASYHGLPERQLRKAAAIPGCLEAPDCCQRSHAAPAGCYRAQCFATTQLLGDSLALDPSRTSTAFQSRLGRTPWIGPHTDAVLPELYRRGVRRLAVLCPAFVADCLETLEEIGLRARAQWEALGGEAFELIPCLNAHPSWVAAVEQIVREKLVG